MLRKACIAPPQYPHHVVLRTHHRRVVFVHDDDYRFCLSTLRQWKQALGVRIFAYCLLSRRIELIADAGEKLDNLKQLTNQLAARQAQHWRRHRECHGKLWERRYHLRPIGPDGEFFPRVRRVELSPVRACVVADPKDYRWCSYQTKVSGAGKHCLDLDPTFVALAKTAKRRAAKYREFVGEGLTELERSILNRAVTRGYLVPSGA